MLSRFLLFIKLKPERRHLLVHGFYLAIYSYFLYTFNQKNARYGGNLKNKRFENETNLSYVADIRFVIMVLTKYTLFEFMCRHQAWVASQLLQKYHIPYTIYVGFKKNPTGLIEGHAWTISQNIMISGFCNPEEYIIQAKYKG